MAAKPLFRPISATEFRVLHLLPGTFDQDIQCVLEVRPSEVKTRYEAVSYQWGDSSVTKPIRIAHHDSSPRPTERRRIAVLPWSWTGLPVVSSAFGALQVTATRYKTVLWAVACLLCSYIVWRLLSPFPAEGPSWISWLIPRDLYISLLCLFLGGAMTLHINQAFMLAFEIAKTKPWQLAYSFPAKQKDRVNFEDVHVAASLELALRYLRLETRTRTLWVDALCIDQGDEAEKSMQIRGMDRIYANASQVVVWLGGYHGITETGTCQEAASQMDRDCMHRRQIQSTFDLIWTMSSWRLLVPFSDKETRLQEGLPGLREISRRGWWKRLWVVQEVALATGHVQIQCGHNTCSFDGFRHTQITAQMRFCSDEAVQEDLSPSDRFGDMVKYVCYDDFSDSYTRILADGLRFVWRRIFPGTGLDKTFFREQSVAQRLQHVLLRTAGRFQCREDRDRLNAVLGIAGGARTGKASMTAGFVRWISSHSLHVILISNSIHPWLESSSSLAFKRATHTVIAAVALWAIFYHEIAKYWTFNRPEFVVAGYSEIMDAVAGPTGQQRSRVEFFAALARYLGHSTKTLAFLDAASCGQDVDGDMPSWVPTWTREVSGTTYQFSASRKQGQAVDTFKFTENGTALELVGWAKGKIHAVRSTDVLANWLALPWDFREAVKSAFLEPIELPDQASASEEVDQVWVSRLIDMICACRQVGPALLIPGGSTYIYSLDEDEGEAGFLRAGEAAEGDRLVYVPGCFHRLVLRKQPRTASAVPWWKLVGLVEMDTEKMERQGCSAKDWAEHRKGGKLNTYTIV